MRELRINLVHVGDDGDQSIVDGAAWRLAAFAAQNLDLDSRCKRKTLGQNQVGLTQKTLGQLCRFATINGIGH